MVNTNILIEFYKPRIKNILINIVLLEVFSDWKKNWA